MEAADTKEQVMSRLDEWLTELKQATEDRIRSVRPAISNGELGLLSVIRVIEERKYKFVIVGTKGRFAIAMDDTIYGFKNNDINKKENYGNVETLEEFDWSTYFPTRKSLYDWQQDNGTTTEDTPATSKRKTRKRPMVDHSEGRAWPFTEGISVVSERMSEQCTKLGIEGTPNNRHSGGNGERKDGRTDRRKNKKQA
jgi:hypothetical protein